MNEFDKLKEELLNCRYCKDIFYNTPKPIFQGKQNAKIMQISQAPSKTVMETGKPFNDASGKRLKQQWYEINDEQFYNPDNFYIASIARCYPGKAKTSGDKAPPSVCAQRFLRKELDLIHPQMYIVIGSYAAKWMFPNDSFDDLIFRDHTYNDRPLFVLPHPSPLNRRWFKEHPEFEKERIKVIREKIKAIIKEEVNS